jgi:CelD/BcsL family acetyltransferase involved in cellulose biosynthesis
VRAELIGDPAGIRGVEDGWRELAVARSNGFVTPEWFWSWHCYRGQRSTPLVSVARRPDGGLAGVMPLVLDTTRRPRAIRFAGAALGDRFHPAAAVEDEDEVAEATARALAAAGLGRRMLVLDHVESDRTWWQRMAAASPVRVARTEQQHTRCPYVSLEGLDWEGYLAGRRQKFRKNLRQGERRLLREHAARLISAGEDDLRAGLDHLFRLHALRFPGRESSLTSGGAEPVLRAWAEAAHRRGWLRLNLLEAEGEIVAAVLAWRVGRSYATYQGGFDPAWSGSSVGTVLEGMTIRRAIEEGASEYDFLLGEEDYKRRFTGDSARSAHTVVMTGAHRPLRVLVAGEAGARRLAGSLQDRPALARVARSLRALLPTARGS